MKIRILMILLIMFSMFIVVGCSLEEMPENVPTETYKVKCMVNGKKYETMTFEEDERIKFPNDPVLEGYEFVDGIEITGYCGRMLISLFQILLIINK